MCIRIKLDVRRPLKRKKKIVKRMAQSSLSLISMKSWANFVSIVVWLHTRTGSVGNLLILEEMR